MTALPPKAELDGSSSGHNQGVFKAAIGGLRDFLSGLLGTDGTQATALAALKVLDPQAIYNLKPVFGVASNALTCTIKDRAGNDLSSTNPGFIGQRAATASDGGFNLRTIAANVALTISSGSTLGHASGTPGRLHWYLLDNAGVAVLAVSGSYQGLSGLYTTTAEGGAGGADSESVLYAAGAHSNLPGRLIAVTTDTQTTAGTWTATPTQVSVQPQATPRGDVSAPQGRLSLTSGLAVTTADVTGATTVYYTPYQGNLAPIYDGEKFVMTKFSELSQATTDTTKSPAAVANNSNYDIFLWNDAGTLRATRGPAWNTDTSRGTGADTTELEVIEGRHVNKVGITNGPAARRGLYVGTIRSNGSAQINDSAALRHVWNNCNRVRRDMIAVEGANTWSYTTPTLRQANANAANQLDFIVGLSEGLISAEVRAMATNSSGATGVQVGIGLDSTTVDSSQTRGPSVARSDHALLNQTWWKGVPSVGRHTLVWLESSAASGTTTWYGDNGGTAFQTGIVGEMMA